MDHVIQPFSAWSLASLLFLYLSVNWLGLYTKYLTERAQRKAFLETRRSLETRLVLSLIKCFVENRLVLSGDPALP